MPNEDYIARLLLKMIAGTLSEEERKLLDQWQGESQERKALCQRLKDNKYLERNYRQRSTIDTARPMADMKRRIRRIERRRQTRVLAIAASILLIVAAGAVMLWKGNVTEPTPTIAQAQSDSTMTIRPGSTKAMLTLPNGEQLALGNDNAANQKAVTEGMAEVKGEAKALCLDVPRGGEFKVELEDGSEVWLNSASQLVYPEHFATAERRVKVKGEAYFKVAKDSERPFLVETDGQLVRVYGTQFNVRSYREDADVKTTLVEGSIALSKMSGNGGEVLLTPGHQSSFRKTSEVLSVNSVDTDVVTCWRNGKFVFENQDLESIMQDLSRWYNFEYSFANAKLKKIVFMGSIPRYAEFSTALAIIEKSGNIKFNVNGNKVEIR